MEHNRIPFLPKIIATGFGSGYSPIAPGTAGALSATLIWGIISYFTTATTLWWTTIALILIFSGLGVWSASIVEKYWGDDPKKVVIDEVVGVWISLLAVNGWFEWYYAVYAFILFRFFDIVKPLGVRKMENFPSGWGIMADDVLAGIYALIIIYITKWIG